VVKIANKKDSGNA